MDLYLQFGYGMKKNTIDLAKKWGEATVILSPRDIEPESLGKWSKEFQKNMVKTLFDPQCYYPNGTHQRLAKYDYISKTCYTNLGIDVGEAEKQLRKIEYYNEISNTFAFIIPGIMREKVNEEWFDKHSQYVEAALKIIHGRPLYMTIALPQATLMGTNEAIEEIIEKAKKWPVHGFYIVAEHPQYRYLVENPVWLSNLLDLCAGLKLEGKKVILGYANHQMLCATMSRVDAIASGTWLNVRTFTDKFSEVENQVGRRNTWYYYPQALSEYKIPFLDLAFNKGILSKFKPDESIGDEYAKILFSGAAPTSTSYSESDAFKHYLHSLKMQIQCLEKKSYDEAMAAQELLLVTAERSIEFTQGNGIFSRDRDFSKSFDTNRAALHSLDKSRGFVLRNEWNIL